MLHGPRHGVDVARRAGDRLRDHAAAEVVDPGREVAGLAHHRAERGPDDGLGLLLDHRDEAVPHHLAVDGVERRRVGLHGAASRPDRSSMTMWPSGSIEAANSAGTIVEVWSSAMTAGPAMPVPGESPPRQ